MTWLALIVGLACVPFCDPVTNRWLRERWRVRRIESETNRVRRRRAEAKVSARPWLSTKSLSNPGLSASMDEMRKRQAAFERGPAEYDAHMRSSEFRFGVTMVEADRQLRKALTPSPFEKHPTGARLRRPQPNPTRPYSRFDG